MTPDDDTGSDTERSEILRALREIERRIAELAPRQLDADLDDHGEPYLLQEVTSSLLARATTVGSASSILDSLPAQIAMLDSTGHIVAVNEAWIRAAREGMAVGDPAMLGWDYLGVCDAASGESAADGRNAAAGIRSVLDGSALRYEMEYPCETPRGMRWFRLVASPVVAGTSAGATVMHVDITDPVEAEKSLRSSEGLYQALFNNNPQATWVYDVKTLRFLAVNQAAIAHYGYSLDEFMSMTITDIRAQSDVPQLREYVTAVSEDRDASGDSRHIRRDGSVIVVATSSAAVSFQGRVARLEQAVDVTARLADQERLAAQANELMDALALVSASEVRYRALVERAGDAVLVADDDGRYVDANPAAGDLLGLPPEDIIGRSSADFVVDVADMGDAATAWEAFLAMGEARGVVRLRRPDGVIRDAEFTATANVTSGRHLSILRDVSEREAAEVALRRSEDRFRSMLQDLSAFALITSRDGTVWFINDAMLAATGYEREAVLGRVGTDLFTPPEHREAASAGLEAAFATETIGPGWENEIATLSGARRLVRWSSSFLYDSGEIVGLASIGEDLTEQRLFEEQVRQTQRLESVGQLTGGVAHDFNNLLTVIMGNGELLVEALEDRPEDRELAVMTIRVAERGAELTRSLLAFARQQPLAPTSVDVKQLVEGMGLLLRRSLGEHVDLELKAAEDLWSALIDPTQLENAVLQLAINARDAMPTGGVLVIEMENTWLDEEYVDLNPEAAPGEYVMVAVSDTGSGIDPEHLARVFDPFFTTKAKGWGTGLGLSMVYGFVKQSGGHVKLYSESGEGTTIRLYLPRTKAAVPTAERSSEVLVRGSETVLLVEDSEQVRDQAVRAVTALGYRVLSAENGPSALAILRSRDDIDLLFTDVVMSGGMSGRQLADAAQQHQPGLRVLYTSGYTDSMLDRQGRLDPGVRLLSKPYRRADLARALRDALDA